MPRRRARLSIWVRRNHLAAAWVEEDLDLEVELSMVSRTMTVDDVVVDPRPKQNTAGHMSPLHLPKHHG